MLGVIFSSASASSFQPRFSPFCFAGPGPCALSCISLYSWFLFCLFAYNSGDFVCGGVVFYVYYFLYYSFLPRLVIFQFQQILFTLFKHAYNVIRSYSPPITSLSPHCRTLVPLMFMSLFFSIYPIYEKEHVIFVSLFGLFHLT
jgi:hypothetical protein